MSDDLNPDATNYPEEEGPKQKEPCFACGELQGLVKVHGHIQCAACNAVIERCCGD